MPELPEVETIRRGLLPLIGSQITKAEVFRERSVRMHDGGAEAFAVDAEGLTIQAAVRRGKFLWLFLIPAVDTPLSSCCAQSQHPDSRFCDGVSLAQNDEIKHKSASALLVHLGMSGQLRHWESTPAPPHLRVRFYLQMPNGSAQGLDFIDQRTFGHLAIVDLVPTKDHQPGGEGSLDATIPQPAAHIARDVLDPYLNLAVITKRIKSKNTEIKRVLLDQAVVSGIGNIYADEALWAARIHPQTIASALSAAQIKSIIGASQQVITKSLAVGGTSFDALYVNVNGESGTNSVNLNVYGRENIPCPICQTPIERIVFMNRSSHLCPKCQPKRRQKRG